MGKVVEQAGIWRRFLSWNSFRPFGPCPSAELSVKTQTRVSTKMSSSYSVLVHSLTVIRHHMYWASSRIKKSCAPTRREVNSICAAPYFLSSKGLSTNIIRTLGLCIGDQSCEILKVTTTPCFSSWTLCKSTTEFRLLWVLWTRL